MLHPLGFQPSSRPGMSLTAFIAASGQTGAGLHGICIAISTTNNKKWRTCNDNEHTDAGDVFVYIFGMILIGFIACFEPKTLMTIFWVVAV